MSLKVAILHNAVAADDAPADRDVLVQVAAVESACQKLGHRARAVSSTLNFEALEEWLSEDGPDVVFNLVESLGGSDRLAHLAAELLGDLDIPYTGTPAAALHLTNNKPLAKQQLRAAGLPTPDWTTSAKETPLAPPYIIKAVWEHASLGLDDHAVVTSGDGSTVAAQIESRSRQLGRPCFAERFIPGREFNLSLLAAAGGPQVLPPAEIDFSSFPKNKPQIVGYDAKWVTGTFEFDHTPRTFKFAAADAPLLANLAELATRCWSLFDLRGHVRIDFRVDGAGQPWILEINANPCLAPDAGFAAALTQAGLAIEQAVDRILADALRSGARRIESPRTQRPKSPSETKSFTSTPATLRTVVRAGDGAIVRRIVEATELFRPAEVDVAVELVEARLAKGPASGYEFVFAEQNGGVVGYACFGKNTLTTGSFDLYWIAVDPRLHGRGVGRQLLEAVERQIAAAGGTRIYIETSHRPDYVATRGFYERCGYKLAAVLDDYYAPGDGKAIYIRTL